MTTLVRVLTIALVASTRLAAQPDAPLASAPVTAATRAELVAAREAVWRAWFAGDHVRLGELIPAALAAGESHGWSDRARSMGDAKDFAASGGKLVDIRFDSTAITLHGPVAVMWSRYTYVLQDKAGKRTTTRGVATEVFVHEKGRWVNPFWYLDQP